MQTRQRETSLRLGLHLPLPFTIIFFVKTFDRFEKLIEQLVEGPFERLFNAQLHPADLARALAREMERGRLGNGRGGCIAPNHYRVFLNTQDYQVLQERSALAEEVAAIKRYLRRLATESGCEIPGSLRVQMAPQSTIQAGQIIVSADHLDLLQDNSSFEKQDLSKEEGSGSKKTTPLDKSQRFERPAAISAARWQLQLPDRVVTLGMPVVRMGGGANNDVVISDRTVAKHHAQLRWRNRAYYVQNLSRTRLLKVNHQPVTTSLPLRPGDRLQLGQVIIYVNLKS